LRRGDVLLVEEEGDDEVLRLRDALAVYKSGIASKMSELRLDTWSPESWHHTMQAERKQKKIDLFHPDPRHQTILEAIAVSSACPAPACK
jgi:hypothetical protein